jgi:periplasmic protein TonB
MKRVTILGLVVSFLLCLWTSAAFGQDQDGAHTKFDKNPIPVRTPPPQVPSELKGQNGIVSVVVIIDEKGDVFQATVSKSTDAAFEAASIEAVKKWKFKPAEVGGQVVKAKVTIPIHFSAAK